jgi:hypothetical protein
MRIFIILMAQTTFGLFRPLEKYAEITTGKGNRVFRDKSVMNSPGIEPGPQQ